MSAIMANDYNMERAFCQIDRRIQELPIQALADCNWALFPKWCDEFNTRFSPSAPVQEN